MRRRFGLAALAGLLVLTSPSGAQEPAVTDLGPALELLDAEEIDKIPIGVVTLGEPIPARDAPGVVDVIPESEIRASGARTLAELLERRVGIDVSIDRVVPRGLSTAPSTGLPIVNHRSLLLVDGRAVNGTFFGEFLAGRELPLDHVRQIEISRGPGSALYGTNAMAGVINVVTKSGKDAPGIGAVAEYGSFSTRRFDLSGGWSSGPWDGSFFLRHYASGGTDQVLRHDDQRQYFAFARSTLGPLTLHFEGLNFREETPGRVGAETPSDHVRRERYSTGAHFVERFGGRFRLEGRSYGNFHETRFHVAEADPSRSAYDEQRFGNELALTYDAFDWLSVTFGGEARFEDGDVDPGTCVDRAGALSTSCSFDREVFAAFLEEILRLPADLALTAGFRYDAVSGFGGRASPRVNLRWSGVPWASITGGYGEAFRAPGFFELRGLQQRGSSLLGGPAEVVLGNPSLDSEVVRTADGELRVSFGPLANLRLGGFVTWGDDLVTQVSRADLAGIDLCPPPGEPGSLLCVLADLFPPAAQVSEFRFVNAGNLTVGGVELAFGGRAEDFIHGDLLWDANYTWQDAEIELRNPGTGEGLTLPAPLVPDHKINLLLDYRPLRELSVLWHTRWVSEQRTGLESPPGLDSFFNHDFHLLYRPLRGLELAVGLYNVLDGGDPEAANVLREPRTVLASLGYRWRPGPAVPRLEKPGGEPEALAEARVAVERARAAGASRIGSVAFREALVHLRIAEEMHRRGEEASRVAHASERARRQAEFAREQARLAEADRMEGEAAPTVATLPPTPVPAPGSTPRPTPTSGPPRRATATPRVRDEGILPPVAPPSPIATPSPARAATPTPTRTPVTTPTPTPTRTATPTPEPSPTPTPRLDVSNRRVLLLQSDGDVAIYRAAASALIASLPAKLDLQDLGGDAEAGREILERERTGTDLIVAIGSLAATLARNGGGGRPVLYCAVLNPERYDLRSSNVAGVSYEISVARQLEAIREALGGRNRIGVIHDPDKSGSTVRAAERIAGRYGFRIVAQEAERPEEVAALFRSLKPEIDLLWLIPDSTVVTRESFELLALEAAEAGIPVVAFAEAFARQGALMALYPDPSAVGRQCAALATALLRGEARISEIGARAPDRFACVVNRRIGGQLGVSVPEHLCTDVGG